MIKGLSARTKLFVIVHLVLIPLALWGSVSFASRVNARRQMPKLNNTPRVVLPEFDYPLVVSDDQLRIVLEKIRPKFTAQPAKTNFVDHALRLWGARIIFDDQDSVHGADLRRLLINSEHFQETWGEEERPLLMPKSTGLAVRTQEGRSSVSHVDHMLASLAEVGTQLDHEVVGPNDLRTTMFQLVRHAIEDFSLNQQEYEWTVLTLALYSPKPEPWITSERQEVSFDVLASRIMRQPQPQGVCYGQHRLYTLTLLLRIDDQIRDEEGIIGFAGKDSGLLSISSRLEVIEYLKSMTAALYVSQSVEGYWDANWPDLNMPIRDPETDELSRRILATGHTLEWWSMAPENLHPPRATIVRAGQWLAKVIGEMDEAKIQKNYTFLTHAARALALWRGKSAAEHYQEFFQTAPLLPRSAHLAR